MSDFIRTHRHLMFLMLLILVSPSFVLFGMQSYSSFMDSPHDAAEVDDKVISTNEVDARVHGQTERLHQMLSAQYDPRQFEGPQARRGALDGIIQQRMPANKTARANLAISNEKIRDTILQIPTMATLRRPDDSFDQEVYVRLLSAQNITPEQLEDNLRLELSQQQILQPIMSSAFVLKSLVDRLIQVRDQQREIQALLFKPADYAAKVSADDKATQTYYDAHQQGLSMPEQVKAEYIVLSDEEMVKQIPATPGQLKEYHDQNAAHFKIQEERHTVHILAKLPDNAEPVDKEAARKKAEEILAEVRKSFVSFADLVRKYSGNPGSVAQGGELGFLSEDAIMPSFKNALFTLKQPDDINDMVQSDSGLRIIKLEEVRGGGVQPLEAVKPGLGRKLRT